MRNKGHTKQASPVSREACFVWMRAQNLARIQVLWFDQKMVAWLLDLLVRQAHVPLDAQRVFRKTKGLHHFGLGSQRKDTVVGKGDDRQARLRGSCRKLQCSQMFGIAQKITDSCLCAVVEEGGQAKLCLAQESQKIVACLADKADETVACACGKKAHRNCPAVNAKVGRAGSGRHGNPAGFGHAKGR